MAEGFFCKKKRKLNQSLKLKVFTMRNMVPTKKPAAMMILNVKAIAVFFLFVFFGCCVGIWHRS